MKDFTVLAFAAALATLFVPVRCCGEHLHSDDGPVHEIVFATRNHVHDGHWYANFGYYATSPERCTYGTQGRLCIWACQSGRLRLLIDDPAGAVRDPCVSYDAKRIVFAYRPAGTPHYHLYEIGIDGQGLRQLTTGRRLR